MNYKVTSALSIVGRVYTQLRPQGLCSEADMIEWIGEALDHIGVGCHLESKKAKIEIKDYKGLVPCDFYILDMIVGVSYNNSNFVANTTVDNFNFSSGFSSNKTGSNQALVPNNSPFPFQNSDNKAPNYGSFAGNAKIEWPYVKASFEKGVVYMAYQGFGLDKHGYPLVPDNISFKEAFFFYIFKNLIMRGYQHPEFNWDKADYQWKFYCSQARNSYNMPDVPQMEALMQSWVRLIPQMDAYQTLFTETGQENLIRTHNNYLLP